MTKIRDDMTLEEVREIMCDLNTLDGEDHNLKHLLFSIRALMTPNLFYNSEDPIGLGDFFRTLPSDVIYHLAMNMLEQLKDDLTELKEIEDKNDS